MIVHLLCNDGSPLGVTSKTIWGDVHRIGVGGAELALITLCEELHKVGHQVTLYNDPWEYNTSPFKQAPIAQFNPNDDRDILIVFRSPNPRMVEAKGLKVWLSTDQKTVGNFEGFAKIVDKIVCISPAHAEYFAKNYNIKNITVIDLPVRIDDFKNYDVVKIPNRIIFTSVPARGLDNLNRMWKKIKKEVPDASLVITSDYRLWGVGHPSNEQFIVKWLMEDDVDFIGAVSRKRLIEEQLKADILLYPSNYEELFCIAVAEAQYAGAYPITSGCGALKTTNMGTVIDVDADNPYNDQKFIDATVELLSDRFNLVEKQIRINEAAKNRFDPEMILKQWDEKVFNG